MNRRHFSSGLAVLALTLTAAISGTASADAPKTVRIGFQKSSTLINVLKANGELEKALSEVGVSVTWSEFPSGLPLLEALNVGAIDVSGDVADTVPIFAQAAGAKLTYLASEAPSPSAQALVVKSESPIKSLTELKGKKIAVAKASGSHYLLIAALAQAGLKFNDIEPAYLTPADGRAAFEKGAVDAWATWDPFVAAVQKQSDVRILADGKGIADYQRYYLASSAFAAQRPDVLNLVFAKLKETGEWVKKNPEAAAQLLAPVWGLDSEIVSAANARRSYDVRPVGPENLTDEQKIADAFFAEGILPKQIKASDAEIWAPAKKAAAN
ncbi:aliphatic sulfonate ABC transporter substrate-binding protein [Hyphomicrobium facile]|uniref:Putative aliphatic sulfonates-binding protein n=1 Tax=Hyphomicrobium facile TaxID=51670 RepID=A0A1I7MUE5_9HYPH|nr:aliphatic sulfonate ABC transporter substrate-binding protein [Hyphomicrobium facile]SFV26005.1 sulfonate transport system substrate-binding protein [Hyphomicrobium facile]